MNGHDVVQRIMMLGALSKWVVLMGSASAMMQFPGFRRAHDIDLVAHPVVFWLLCVLRPSGWTLELSKKFFEFRLVNKELEIEMFMRWRTRRGYVSYRELKKASFRIKGVCCASITEVLAYKRWLCRSKDLNDVCQLRGLMRQLLIPFLPQPGRQPTLAPGQTHWQPPFLDSG